MDKKKIAVITVLALGAVGTWVPQITKRTKASRSTAASAGVGPEPVKTFMQSQQGASPDPETETAAPSDATSDAAASLAEVVEGLRAVRSRRTVDELDELAQAWSASRGSAEPEVLGPISGPRSETRPESAPEDPVQAFLSANSLSATIVGPSRTVAMVGGRVVRPGDAVLPGVLFVDRIADDHVVLVHRTTGDEHRLDLPPFRTRAAEASERGPSDQPGTPDESTQAVPVADDPKDEVPQ
ncbi:MAG: hypothetical protein GY711_17410 [bacterium]|nr:hypothetical protein [bacterium]